MFNNRRKFLKNISSLAAIVTLNPETMVEEQAQKFEYDLIVVGAGVILIATTAQLWWHTALSAYQAGLYVPKTTAQGIHRQINTDSQF